MSIKYYRLDKDEEPPEEFCAVRDVGGEPSEYVFYVPERENAKLRELARDAHTLATDHGVYVRYPYCDAWDEKLAVVEKQMRELGIEVDA